MTPLISLMEFLYEWRGRGLEHSGIAISSTLPLFRITEAKVEVKDEGNTKTYFPFSIFSRSLER